MHRTPNWFRRAYFAPDDGGAAGGDGGTSGQPGVSSTEHPATAPWSGVDGMYNVGEGDKAKPWFETIQEEPVRELMKAKGYKNPTEVAMAYHNLNKLQNNAPDVVAMPKADAPKEDWDKFYNKMGRPESPDKYDIKAGEGLPMSDKMVKIGKEIFYEAGVSPAKAAALTEKWNGFVKEHLAEQAETQRVQNDKDLNDLNTRWGADVTENKAAGLRTMQALGLPDALMQKIEGSIGSAAVVELLATIGRKSDEGNGLRGIGNSNTDPNSPAGMTPEQAQAKIEALQNDKDFQEKYTNKSNPEHATALALMEQLFAKSASRK